MSDVCRSRKFITCTRAPYYYSGTFTLLSRCSKLFVKNAAIWTAITMILFALILRKRTNYARNTQKNSIALVIIQSEFLRRLSMNTNIARRSFSSFLRSLVSLSSQFLSLFFFFFRSLCLSETKNVRETEKKKMRWYHTSRKPISFRFSYHNLRSIFLPTVSF